MNPLEEKVREAINKLALSVQHGDDARRIYNLEQEATTSILALIDGEVRAERERCAKVAEEKFFEYHHLKNFGVQIATAIRSSGEGK